LEFIFQLSIFWSHGGSDRFLTHYQNESRCVS
jgi:hypothetical protein